MWAEDERNCACARALYNEVILIGDLAKRTRYPQTEIFLSLVFLSTQLSPRNDFVFERNAFGREDGRAQAHTRTSSTGPKKRVEPAHREALASLYLAARSRFVTLIGLSAIKEKGRADALARRVANFENRVSRLYRLPILPILCPPPPPPTRPFPGAGLSLGLFQLFLLAGCSRLFRS
jgi:hypothetical protein